MRERLQRILLATTELIGSIVARVLGAAALVALAAWVVFPSHPWDSAPYLVLVGSHGVHVSDWPAGPLLAGAVALSVRRRP